MLDDFSVDKRGLHRRLTGGLKRVNNKRVYTPTAIFTHWDTETDTTTAPADPTTSESHSLAMSRAVVMFAPALDIVTAVDLCGRRAACIHPRMIAGSLLELCSPSVLD